jgi:hypothetical protein
MLLVLYELALLFLLLQQSVQEEDMVEATMEEDVQEGTMVLEESIQLQQALLEPSKKLPSFAFLGVGDDEPEDDEEVDA